VKIKRGDYRVTTDPYQWTFQEYKGTSIDKKTGESREVWDTVAIIAAEKLGLTPQMQAVSQKYIEALLRDVRGAQDDLREVVDEPRE